MSISMLTDGWICAGGAAIGMITGGWICVPLSDTISPVVTDPLVPLHITQIQPRMQLRVVLKGGHQMVPKVTKNGNILVPTDKRRTRRNYEKGILVGSVVVNQPEAGQLTMNVYDEVSKLTYRADVTYTAISITRRIIQISELVETAINPGTIAFGSKLVGGQLLNPRHKLVNVKF
jgi:hypothetical protein